MRSLGAGAAGSAGPDGVSALSSAMAHPLRKITPASQPRVTDNAIASKP